MAERVVTDEMIFAAADRITAEGGKVTVRAIWAELGGSMTTINRGVQRWRLKMPPEAPSVEGAIPASFAQFMEQVSKGVWNRAHQIARKEHETKSVDLKVAADTANSATDSALAELQEAVQEAENSRVMLDYEIPAKLAAENLNDELLRERSAANGRADAAEIVVRELRARIEDLATQREHAQTEIHLAQKQVAAASTEAARSMSELSDVRLREVESNTMLGEARKQVASLREHAAHLEAAAAEASRRAKSEIDAARAEARESAQEAAHLRGELIAAQRQIGDLVAILKVAPAAKALRSATGPAATKGAKAATRAKARKPSARRTTTK